MYSSCHATDCILRVHVCFAAFSRLLYFAKQEKLSLATYKLPGGCHTDAEEPIQLHITLLHKGENRKPKPGTTSRPHLARRQVRTGFLLNQTIPQKFSLVEHTSERPHCIEKISTSPGAFGNHVGTEKRQCRSHRSAVLSKIFPFFHLFRPVFLSPEMRILHRMTRIFFHCTQHCTANVHPKGKAIVHPLHFPSRAAAVHLGVLHVCATYTLSILVIW